MYSPPYAVQSDPSENERIIREYPFATIVFNSEAYHLPLLLEGKTLIGHMARANPAWKALDRTCALFIFHGPHHYISPDFYGTDRNVPTWNYVSVHVRGEVTIREDEAFLKKALLTLSQKSDPQFDIEKNIADHKNLFGSIVGIEVRITEIFGKFKLAQSKPEEERQNVIQELDKLSTDQAKKTAEEMRRTLKSNR